MTTQVINPTDPPEPTAPQLEGPVEVGDGHIDQGTEYLVFVTDGRKFAVPITDVREIRGWSEPTPIPHAPPHLLGVVNLRGTVLPVVDLARRLGLAATAPAERNVFIVIEIGSRPLGLLVEAVADIHASSGDDHQALPAGSTDLEENCIEGLLVSGETMIQILNPAALATLLDPESASTT